MIATPKIIGLDGGASKVSGVIIKKSADSFTMAGQPLEKLYAEQRIFNDNFSALDINFQLSALLENNIKITEMEKTQGSAIIKSFSQVIQSLAQEKSIIAGVGMPGIKTGDKRGIAVMLNGPRIPDFCRLLEIELKSEGIKLAASILNLNSDGYLCGLGEEKASGGNFKNVENAYYLGGGTGTAEVLKLEGRLFSFDEQKDWILKSWEMQDAEGISLESYASAAGIEFLFGRNSKTSGNAGEIFKLALAGNAQARKIFVLAGEKLGELIYERIVTIYAGWQGNLNFMRPEQGSLLSKHAFRFTLLDKIVLGQQLAGLLEQSKTSDIYYSSLINRLTSLINKSIHLNQKARKHYLINNLFNESLLVLSALRAAPAFGAGIRAYEDWQSIA